MMLHLARVLLCGALLFVGAANAADSYADRLYELAWQKQDALIDELEGLVAATPPGLRRSELMFRLATQLDERAWRILCQGYDAVDADYMGRSHRESSTLQAILYPYESAARRDQDRAIALYRQVLAETPGYSRNDEVSAALGSLLMESYRADEAIAVFERATATFTSGPSHDRMLINLAELRYDDNQLAAALYAYAQLADGDGPYRDLAIYKIAWIQHRLSDTEDGFESLVSLVEQPADRSAGYRYYLQDEAWRDLIDFSLWAEDPAEARRAIIAYATPDQAVSLNRRLDQRIAEYGLSE